MLQDKLGASSGRTVCREASFGRLAYLTYIYFLFLYFYKCCQQITILKSNVVQEISLSILAHVKSNWLTASSSLCGVYDVTRHHKANEITAFSSLYADTGNCESQNIQLSGSFAITNTTEINGFSYSSDKILSCTVVSMFMYSTGVAVYCCGVLCCGAVRWLPVETHLHSKDHCWCRQKYKCVGEYKHYCCTYWNMCTLEGIINILEMGEHKLWKCHSEQFKQEKTYYLHLILEFENCFPSNSK